MRECPAIVDRHGLAFDVAVLVQAAAERGYQMRALIGRLPYCKEALRQDLTRVRIAWDECQSSRDRNAIYGYLTAVFDLVMWWAAEDRAISRARWTLRLQGVDLPTNDEPFAAVIVCTADRAKVDKRTLAAFVLRQGGINKCAARFTRCLGRYGRN